MKMPDGGDYVEFMLYGARPAPDARGTQHHICLEVPDLPKAQSLNRVVWPDSEEMPSPILGLTKVLLHCGRPRNL